MTPVLLRRCNYVLLYVGDRSPT